VERKRRGGGIRARKTLDRQVRGKASHARGLRAEALAALLLRLKGYRILERRLKTRAGEIDILARRGRTLAIVEVKARTGEGAAREALRPHQQARLWRAGEQLFALRPDLAGCDMRFDLVLVTPSPLPFGFPGGWPRHLPDAWRD
jgi:putative endonuclease